MSKIFIPLLSLSGALVAAQNAQCPPEPPVPCYPDNCTRCYCLGPDNIIANAPVCPMTCNGDFSIEVAGLYWQATEDGLEFAVSTNVTSPATGGIFAPDEPNPLTQDQALNNLIDATYEVPNFKWDFGFRVGLSYCTACDGWDIGARWTWFRGKADDHLEIETLTGETAVPSAPAILPNKFRLALKSFRPRFLQKPKHVKFNDVLNLGQTDQDPVLFGINFATDIEADWKSEFNIVDIELGRKFWTSHYLAFRPLIGVRILFIDQTYEIQHRGGSYGPIDVVIGSSQFTNLEAIVNRVHLRNDYKGVGLRAGFDTDWHFGCGWSAFGELAASIIYGRFSLRNHAEDRLAISPFSKRTILEIGDSFRASRPVLDAALGIEWGGLVCDCKYGINISLAWEQHIFFHQNQIWDINQIGAGIDPVTLDETFGENNYDQRHGTLTTQGLTLKFEFTF